MATIWLLPNTQYVRFEEIAHLIALALYPESRKLEATEMERLKRFAALENLAPELKHAVDSGALQPKDPLTRGPHSFPIGQALKDALIAVDNLRTYVADRSIEVKEMLIFETLARPLAVDPRLAALNPTDKILITENIGGLSGSGFATVGNHIMNIQAIMARQAEGFFTINEAAQVLADTYPGLEVKKLKTRIKAAQLKGRALARQSDRFPIEQGETFREFLCVASVPDLNAWLVELGTGYKFPDAPGTGSVKQARPTEENDWIVRAKARAREIIAEQKAQDLYPNQETIADQIAKEFRKAGTFSVSGKPPNGAYIKRHALKGISSAVAKQLSTAIPRGK